MWIFYFIFWTAVRASAEGPLYRKIGDQAVLTPDSVENPITNMRWKHGDNIAMEWYGDETISYRQFKGRGSLNISTGVMTITGLTPDLSGIYTAEINGKETSKTELLVISPVPKPNLTVSCEKTYCDFTCSGSITGAEPVTYWWTAGEKRWTSTKELRITKEDKEQWFSCTLENPLGSISSEEVFNPFMESNWKWMFILIPGILVVCIIIIYFIHKRTKFLQSHHQGTKPVWQYAGKKNGEWCDYMNMTGLLNEVPVNSNDIEKLNQQNPHSSSKTPTVHGEPYELDYKEMTPMLPDGRESSTSGVTHGNSNGAEEPSSLPAEEETSIQNTTSAAPETSNETATDSESCYWDQAPWEDERRRTGSCYSKTIGNVYVSSVISDDIERWYQEKRNVKMPLTLDGKPYELDFKEMIQTNLTTRTKRNIRRMMV